MHVVFPFPGTPKAQEARLYQKVSNISIGFVRMVEMLRFSCVMFLYCSSLKNLFRCSRKGLGLLETMLSPAAFLFCRAVNC